MTISKKQLISLVWILTFILFLPVLIYFLKGRYDIRPKAQLAGAANFKLNADNTNVNNGGTVNVLVSAELTDASIRASGVDFLLLYDSSKLGVVSATPTLGNKFTQTVILENSGQSYSGEGGQYKYLRISMISQKPDSELPGGTFTLANVTFEAKQSGAATIKFPDDNSKLQIVGTAI